MVSLNIQISREANVVARHDTILASVNDRLGSLFKLLVMDKKDVLHVTPKGGIEVQMQVYGCWGRRKATHKLRVEGSRIGQCWNT
ncbi:hypothetical protein Ahy_A10g048828 isoform A [Arachis hypogaea]|uniref:Uncharacterized protein n=1 Tax=Arachis hypogaea TaxID=3818 RepID=A0A445B5Z9_ARAHY|nr:hypothetical protein Ahy_A10g048828 isoform A [Arachis hypogaea]